ncbi:MAG: winged helix-turn-helix domain-containing protein, partial [Muribaculaceae bacterium]|nr:winged helix-turn-helix domain-containing protein [Muribaculaceae bacterium]
VLRRAQPHQAHIHQPAFTPTKTNYEPDVTFKNLRIDRNEKQCYINGQEAGLSRREFDLLLFFLTQRERIHSRDEIKTHVWGAEVTDRAIDVTVARLRQKIKPYDENIVTRLGFGYGFKAEV